MEKITIGRIGYGVVLGLMVAALLHAMFYPFEREPEGLASMLLFIVSVILSAALTLIGAVVVVWNRKNRRSNLFWGVSLLLASIPLLIFLAVVIQINLS